MGKLTTHILDTAAGAPGSGIRITLFRLDDDRREIATAETNADGRTDAPLLAGTEWQPGTYELVFSVGPYFRSAGLDDGGKPFLDDVVIRVTLGDDAHYHVPLLVSPWSYTTYRGS